MILNFTPQDGGEDQLEENYVTVNHSFYEWLTRGQHREAKSDVCYCHVD